MAMAWPSPNGNHQRRRHQRRMRGIVAGIVLLFLLPWLFIAQMPANYQNNEHDQEESSTVSASPAYLSFSKQNTVAHYWHDILTASAKTGTPAIWLAGELLEENPRGNPQASDGIAYGLMQIELPTAEALPGYQPGYRHNVQDSLILAGELLKQNAEAFGGNWFLASAAYYAGSGWVHGQGVEGNMPWNEAAALLSQCPAAGNNGLTDTTYVNSVLSYAEAVKAMDIPTPSLLPFSGLPGLSATPAATWEAELTEVLESAGEAALDVAAAA